MNTKDHILYITPLTRNVQNKQIYRNRVDKCLLRAGEDGKLGVTARE